MAKENWLLKGIVIGIISAILAFFVQHYGEFIMGNIGNLVKSFLITFWPLIVGLLVFFLYWIIADYIKLRRFTNNLTQWIGLFSYQDSKGSYSNLKGKIKRYIEEELEKDSTRK
jgi:fructose-specific phosphotransferase system IIC component